MSEAIDELAQALNEMSGVPVEHVGNAQAVKPGERPCPICGALMNVERFHGVQIDTCPAHGIWLDNGELFSVTSQQSSAFNPVAVRRRVREAKRQGQISGALLGVWALLLDR